MTFRLAYIFDCFFHILPVSNKNVFFRAYGGQYSDNPKYISMKLHEEYPSMKIYWTISKKSLKNDIPDYVRCVQPGTIRCAYIKNRCKYIVETGMGYYLDYKPKRVSYLMKKMLLTNRKQFDLSTWHGTPIKCIGAQIAGYEGWTKDNVITTSNGVLCGSDYLKSILKKAFVGICPILEMGTPRTDILFNLTESKIDELKAKLGVPLEKKVILYAPTFRNTLEDSGIKQIESMDIKRLLSALSDRFGGSWIFVIRGHPLIQQSVNDCLSKLGLTDEFVSGNKYEDMMEYLAVADILLTDFSSSVFDFALTSKPCFMYAHDRKEYEANDRGIYEPLSFLPYTFSDTFEDLLKCIKNYDSAIAEANRQTFLKRIGCYEDGNAANRAVEYLMLH